MTKSSYNKKKERYEGRDGQRETARESQLVDGSGLRVVVCFSNGYPNESVGERVCWQDGCRVVYGSRVCLCLK